MNKLSKLRKLCAQVIALCICVLNLGNPLVMVYAQETPSNQGTGVVSSTISDSEAAVMPQVAIPEDINLAVVTPAIVTPTVGESALSAEEPTQIPIEADTVTSTSPTEENRDAAPAADPVPSITESYGATDTAQKAQSSPAPRGKTDTFSGAYTYEYPLTIPEGRNGIGPDISLVYNSQEKNDASWLGYGWSVSIPYIERVNKFGVEKLYTIPTFYSSLDGELATSTNSSHFVPKVDSGKYHSYTYYGNVWKITDTQGISYYFGQNSSARLSDPQNAQKTYRWYLERIEDPLGNTVNYTYENVDGNVYPVAISYTNHASLPGIYAIQFVRSTREDVVTSYASAFPVITKYRIQEIKVLSQNVVVRSYKLRYGTGVNGTRTLLEGITETGYNGDVVNELPEVIFGYKKQPANYFTQNTLQEPSPKPFSYIEFYTFDKTTPLRGVRKVKDKAARIADVNADGLPDILHGGHLDDGRETPDSGVYLNTGYGFSKSSTLQIPNLFLRRPNSDKDYDNGVRLADVNGDGFMDFLQSYQYRENRVDIDINSVSVGFDEGWNLSQSFRLPIRFVDTAGLSERVIQRGMGDLQNQIADVNGDALPDIVSDSGIYINNGSNWVLDSRFVLPQPLRITESGEKFDGGVRFADINNDGLTDIMYASGSQLRSFDTPDPEVASLRMVYINTGTGTWVPAEGMTPSVDIAVFKFTNDSTMVRLDYAPQFNDVNGDGLVDIIYHEKLDTTRVLIGINTAQGIRWKPLAAGVPAYLTFDHIDLGGRFVDMNGDGRTDIFFASTRDIRYDNGLPERNIPKNELHENNALYQDYLVKITGVQGLETTITYDSVKKLTTKGVIPHPRLQWPIDVVSKIEEKDTITGSVYTTSYTYENGISRRDGPFDRRFAGFEKVTEKLPQRSTVYYFHQGNESQTSLGEIADGIAKIGKVYRQEIYNAAGQKMTQTLTSWSSYSNGNRSIVVPLQEIVMDFDGDSSAASKAFTYEYDTQNGRLQKYIEWGRVVGYENGTFADLYGSGASADRYTTTYTYARNPALGLFTLASAVRTNALGATVSESRALYDSLAFGSASFGLPTRKEFRINATSFASTTATYGPRGMLTTVTDTRGNTTRYVSDSSDMFLISVTNPLNQRVITSYDYVSGKPMQVIDSMNVVTRYTYDGLRRLRDTYVARDSTAATQLAERISYDDTRSNPRITTVRYLDDTLQQLEISYKNSFGQEIQKRNRAEDASSVIIQDTIYSWPTLIGTKSLPYTGTGLQRTPIQTQPNLLITFKYDALDRILSEAHIVGETTYVYNDWTITSTDPLKASKKLYYDAYGNMTRIDESSPTHYDITWYGYDANKNLTGIADALGNERYFTYDLLGRRLTAQDLHAKTDTTFGTYKYTYDSEGNMLTSIDPEGMTRTYSYDALNRILSEDSSTTPHVDVRYTYDTCGSWGKGRLCSVQSDGGTQSFVYDPRGRIVQESRTIIGSPLTYTTLTTLDIQGNPTLIIYPNLMRVMYQYNPFGKVENVRVQLSPTAPIQNLVNNYNYHPTGALLTEELASGVTTTYTYDAQELYRLRNRKVTKGTTTYEDAVYTYDKVGNITRLTDLAVTQARRAVDYTYDGYYRLISAKTLASVGGTVTENFTYNKIGNITSNALGNYAYEGATSAHAGISFANPHAPTKIGNNPLTYDKKGNLRTYATQTYTYDYANRLTTISDTATTPTTLVTHTYDHTNSRVKTTVGSLTTYYPNTYQIIEGATTTNNIFANAKLIALVRGVNTASSTTNVHTDHLGSTKLVTDTLGALVQVLDYTTYGNERVDAGTDVSHRQYIGEIFDEVTRLSYLNARYYDPKRGQFLSQDPAFLDIGALGFEQNYQRTLQQHLMSPQAMNSYSYANNNPIKNSDPQGEVVPLLAGAAAGLWALTEAGLSVYDGYTAYQTINNPNTSYLERSIAVSGFVAGIVGPAGGYGAVGREAMQVYKQTNTAGRALMKGVENQKVLSLIRDNYRAGAKIGSGSTADAVRYELQRIGEKVGKKFHSTKAQETINRINNLFRRSGSTLNPQEKNVLNKISNDLKDALKTKNK